MDNQHRKITGYRELNQTEIDLMNEAKSLASQCGALISKLESNDTLDQRCIAIAKTNLQQGWMWGIRSIAQPSTF